MFLFSRENVNCFAIYIKTFHLYSQNSKRSGLSPFFFFFIFCGGEVQTKGFFSVGIPTKTRSLVNLGFNT